MGRVPLCVYHEGESAMDTYQTFCLIFLAGNFLLALLTYVSKHQQ
ncbi:MULTISPECIES: putative holin-like toxin [Caproicibacterium]